jgi:hypothetical protein
MSEIKNMTKRVGTSTPFENAPYPSLSVSWEETAQGWQGLCSIWQDGETRLCSGHTVSVAQTMPLGRVSVSVDDFGYGCLAMCSIDGVSVTERDLQWAACFAAQALWPSHRNAVADCKYGTRSVIEVM